MALLLTGPALAASPAANGAQLPQAISDAQRGKALASQPVAMHYDLPGDGALWAMGTDYKMSFGDAGATYYPRFGARQPANVPLALSPDLVSSSGAPLAFDRSVAATRSGDRVEIDRGAFVEAYDLTPGSVEQTFVFEELPSCGELVLRIPVASELEGRAASAGLEFRGEHGHVTYSRAVAIDARGRRVDAATELVDGAIELRVDTEFLRDAALPLVIDPLVSTFPLDVGGKYDAYSTDIAWNEAHSCWLVVYERKFTFVDSDVYALILNSDGTIRHEGYVDFTGFDWIRPQCASALDQFLVVAYVHEIDTYSIMGRELRGDLMMFDQFTISSSGYNPVVGGDRATSAPAFYAVAYQEMLSATETDVVVRRVDTTSTLIGGPIYLSSGSNSLDHEVAISKSNDSDEWMIAWQRDLSFSETDIYGARFERTGNLTQAPFQLTSAPGREEFASVSSPISGTHKHLVAFETGVGQNSDVSLVLVDGATTIAAMNLSQVEGIAPTLPQWGPSVDCDGTHFAVAYTENQPQPGSDANIYVSELGSAGSFLTLIQRHVNMASGAFGFEHDAAIASYRAAGGTQPGLARRYGLAWETSSVSGREVLGALFDGQDGGTMTPYCFGDGTNTPCPCGNTGAVGHGCANSVNAQGALLQATGTASPTNDTVVLHGSGMPNGSCLYFQGTLLAGSVFGDGLRCVSGATVRLGTETNVAGSSHYPGSGDPSVHVRGQIPNAGGTRFYQAWYRNAASFCTASPFNLSNGLIINWVP